MHDVHRRIPGQPGQTQHPGHRLGLRQVGPALGVVNGTGVPRLHAGPAAVFHNVMILAVEGRNPAQLLHAL